MRRLFAVVLSALLVFGFAPVAKAEVSGLTPCAENPRFQQRASAASTPQAIARFDRYSKAVCGEEGLPHLVVDGRLNHAGDFLIPAIMFLYIAGCIGWAGRTYLIASRKLKDAASNEIIIDTSLAFRCFLGAASWPLNAHVQATRGGLTEDENKVTVSPR